MEAVRGAAAVRSGLTDTVEDVRKTTPAVPKIMAVGPATAYTDLEGRPHHRESHQFVALMAAMGVMHRSLAVTASVAAGVAAVLPGSVVHEIRTGEGSEVHIGHPSGKIVVQAEAEKTGSLWRMKKAGVLRTARRILKGTLFV